MSDNNLHNRTFDVDPDALMESNIVIHAHETHHVSDITHGIDIANIEFENIYRKSKSAFDTICACIQNQQIKIQLQTGGWGSALARNADPAKNNASSVYIRRLNDICRADKFKYGNTNIHSNLDYSRAKSCSYIQRLNKIK